MQFPILVRITQQGFNGRNARITYVSGCAEEVCIVLFGAAFHEDMADPFTVLRGNIDAFNDRRDKIDQFLRRRSLGKLREGQ